MTAFLVSRMTVRNADKLKAYAAAAAPTIAAHGGKVSLRGTYAKSLLGDAVPHGTGILEFPDMAAIEAWFASAEYQALAPLREAAGDMQLVAYEAPSV